MKQCPYSKATTCREGFGKQCESCWTKAEAEKGESLVDRGTLGEKEFHPSAPFALEYIKSLGLEKLTMYLEAYSSCAIEGNRLGEVCGETLHRILKGEPVSDRYVLGLGWSLKSMEEKNGKVDNPCTAKQKKKRRIS